MALLLWSGLAAAWTRTDQPAAGQLVVGYVTVEYDAQGQPHSDGRFYTDQAVAEDLASRRNRGEGDPSDPLDRWWVLPVMAQDPAAARAAAQAAQLRIRASTDQVS